MNTVDAEVSEEATQEWRCNGHQFDTLKEARAYKKRKNAEYGYVRHEIYRRTYKTIKWTYSERVK